MSQETELKLSIPESQVTLLAEQAFWREYAESSLDQFHLGNTYFDTPDMRLNQARVALRIRENQGQFFQTLKTCGNSVNGLTRRGEWEWPIEQPELDFTLLESLGLDELKGIDFDTLTPLFATDFQRTRWHLTWAEPFARIEAALDRGYVKAGGRQSPICELELELLEGDEKALVKVAEQLSQCVDLKPSDKSKAERGFELLNYNK